MERREQALVPEWLNRASGSSSHSDEQSKQSNGVLPRSRLLLNLADQDHGLHRSSSSSYRASSNGSTGHDRDRNPHLRAYSSFGRSHRDRDRDRDRSRDRERDYLLDNGFCDPISRVERDPLRRSQSMITGGRGLSVPKRPGSALSNGMAGSSGGINVTSFEKDFPSLGAEEKVAMSDVGRVNIPGIATSIQSLSLGLPNGCTSALVEAPGRVGSNGPQVSSGLQTAANITSAVASTGTGTGLSMAEAVAHAPLRVHTAPQSTKETERKKELMQLVKLIPMVNKGQVHNSSDKLKSKGSKSGDYNAPKTNLHSSSHPLPVSKDITKASPANNYQVLNWERSGVDSTAKDGLTSRIASREATSLGGGVQAVPSHHLKTTVNPKLKVNGTVGLERKLPSQLQGRSEFFDGLRKQPVSRNSSTTNLETNCVASSSSSPASSSASNLLVESCEQITGASGASASHENDMPNAVENGSNDVDDEDPKGLMPPDEEEAAFLRSLGWEENAGEEALTQEEIESFVSKHPKLSACTKIKAVVPEPRQGGSS